MSKKRRSASRRRGRKRKRRRRRRAWLTMAAFGECLSWKRLHDGPSQVKAVEGKPHALFFSLVEKYQVVIVPFGSRQSSKSPPYQCLNYMQGYLLRCTDINCSPALPWNQVQASAPNVIRRPIVMERHKRRHAKRETRRLQRVVTSEAAPRPCH